MDHILQLPEHIVEKIYGNMCPGSRNNFLKAYAKTSDLPKDPTLNIEVADHRDNIPNGGWPRFVKNIWARSEKLESLTQTSALSSNLVARLTKPKETLIPCHICASNIFAHEFSNPNRFRTLGARMFYKCYESGKLYFRKFLFNKLIKNVQVNGVFQLLGS